MYIFIYIFIYLHIYLFTYLYISLDSYIQVFIYIYIYLLIYLFMTYFPCYMLIASNVGAICGDGGDGGGGSWCLSQNSVFLKFRGQLWAEQAQFASHRAIEEGRVQLLLHKTATARFEADKGPILEPQELNFGNTNICDDFRVGNSESGGAFPCRRVFFSKR